MDCAGPSPMTIMGMEEPRVGVSPGNWVKTGGCGVDGGEVVSIGSSCNETGRRDLVGDGPEEARRATTVELAFSLDGRRLRRRNMREKGKAMRLRNMMECLVRKGGQHLIELLKRMTLRNPKGGWRTNEKSSQRMKYSLPRFLRGGVT